MSSKSGNKTSPKKEPALVVLQPPACPVCGSLEVDGKRHNTNRVETSGVTPEGSPYSVVVFRRCKCANCGQTRIEKTFEA